MIRAVDSNRDPVTANPDVVAGYVTNGEALIGHGTIVAYPRCGYPGTMPVHLACPEECFPAFVGWHGISLLYPHANTGRSVSVYGEVYTGWDCDTGAFTTLARVTRVEPSLCIVAVEPATWGSVKRLYRDATP
jgi:hypothetical protein